MRRHFVSDSAYFNSPSKSFATPSPFLAYLQELSISILYFFLWDLEFEGNDASHDIFGRRFEHSGCLRGKLPFHLLDAIFVATMLATEPPSESDVVDRVKHAMAVPFADRQEGIQHTTLL